MNGNNEFIHSYSSVSDSYFKHEHYNKKNFSFTVVENPSSIVQFTSK